MARFGAMLVTLVGGDKLTEAFARLGERVPRALGAGLYLEANNIMALAVEKAPLDLGTLRGSGYVTHPVVEGSKVSLEAGFGGPAEKYALRQHEELAWRHPDGGEAKYFEKAVNQRSGQFAENVGAFARAALESGDTTVTGGFPDDPSKAAKVSGEPRAKRARKGKRRKGGA